MDDAIRTFTRIPPRFLGIAYRILGSTTEAELVVQDAYSRRRQVAPATPDESQACLITIITRRSLTAIGSRTARVKRSASRGGSNRW